MGAIYLTELATWLRNAGLDVIEYPGWESRARGSGGYDDYPLCVMWHHTASPKSWDGQKDADYIAVGHEDSPISNIYIDRSGTVWILAAGASNTNGKGKSIQFSRGTVPSDGMNSRAIGIEMGNDGIGENWPQAQIDAAFIVSNTCNARFGNRPDDISTHNYYAPDRKIDPATTNVSGLWQPSSCNSSGSWDRNSVQSECLNRASHSGPMPPDSEDTDMFDGYWQLRGNDEVFAVYRNGTKILMRDPEMLAAHQALSTLNGYSPAINVQDSLDMFRAFGPVVGPNAPGCDEWGVK